MIEARFQPLDIATWPGPLSKRRKVPQFRSTWGQTLDLIEAELRFLKARDIVIQAGFSARDLRNDGWPRSDARVPSFPGVIVSFQSKLGPLTYATDTYESGSYWDKETRTSIRVQGWQANVRAIALTLEALRTVDRHGATSRGEQYVGFGALPPATAMGPALTEEAAAQLLASYSHVLLGMTMEDCTVELLAEDSPWVGKAFQLAAKATHPDHGGDPAEFRKLTEARDLLIRGGRS